MCGAQCVILAGQLRMLEWCVGNWDIQFQVQPAILFQYYIYYICNIGTTHATSAFYGQGIGPITLRSVGCTGREARLIDCSSGSVYSCTHAQDAGVRCILHAGKCRCGNDIGQREVSNTLSACDMIVVHICRCYGQSTGLG